MAGSDDTIFALSSGRPPAAVAVIRVSGPRARAAGEALAGALPTPRRAALRDLADPVNGEPIDQALVVLFPGPGSATGEDIVEFQCHGGRAVVDRLLGALAALPGLRAALPGEFTRRALANSRLDLPAAEALAELIEAETESQRRSALARGTLGDRISAWHQRLVMLSARAEAAIDYVSDEEETALDATVLADEARALAGEWREWLERPRVEPLKDGVRVVVAGPVNAGKSSLVNALSESARAIVTDVAGTTRDVIEVPVTLGGVPMVLIDTAGLRASDDRVEAIGIARAESELDRADVVLWLGEPDDSPPGGRTIRVHSRADLAGRETAPAGSLPISTVTGAGLAQLVEEITARAASFLPAEGEVTLNRRQAACLSEAQTALANPSDELLILAEQLRSSRQALDQLMGNSGVEAVLDALFGRFCLGK